MGGRKIRSLQNSATTQHTASTVAGGAQFRHMPSATRWSTARRPWRCASALQTDRADGILQTIVDPHSLPRRSSVAEALRACDTRQSTSLRQ
jgi:hypothetical protein